MKTIILDSIRIENFRGIKSKEIKCGNVVNISGRNSSGKTSIYNAYLWCLFNTDFSGKTIEVRPIESKSGSDVKYIHNVDTTVELSFHDESGNTFTVKRVERENWSTPRGQIDPVYKGQTQDRFFNDVPLSVREFEEKIGTVCNQKYWFMLSSISAFMGLETKERRRVIETVFGGVNEIEIASEFPDVLLALQKGKSMKELRAQNASVKNTAKKDLDNIPARIDQQEKLRVDVDVEHYQEVKKCSEDAKSAYEAQLDEHLKTRPGTESEKHAEQLAKVNKAISDLQDKASKKRLELISGIQTEYNKSQSDCAKLHCDSVSAESRIGYAKKDAEHYEAELQEARAQWLEVNAKEYVDTVETVCPTCGRELDAFKIQELKMQDIESFNAKKQSELDSLVKKGNNAKARLEAAQKDIERFTKEKEEADMAYEQTLSQCSVLRGKLDSVDSVDTILASYDEYSALIQEKNDIQKAMQTQSESHDEAMREFNNRTEQLRGLISSENATIMDANRTLAAVEVNGRIDQEKALLEEERAKLSQAIADCEKIEFEISQFLKKKITMAESNASSYFNLVNWMLYERNVTNEGEKEICEPIVEGIPYTTQNTAKQVNAGMDIINGISNGIGVCVPMFVDNKESVTDLIPTNSQLFLFTVVPGQELTIK